MELFAQAAIVTGTGKAAALALAAAGSGWRIADIHWAGQPDSLVAILAKKDGRRKLPKSLQHIAP